MRKNRAMTELTNPQDDYIRTAMRLPPDLHRAVKSAARAAGHTMNAEIIARIAAAEENASFKTILKQNEELKRLMLQLIDVVEARK